jgi:hypothetical protein
MESESFKAYFNRNTNEYYSKFNTLDDAVFFLEDGENWQWLSSVCVVDPKGKIVYRNNLYSENECLIIINKATEE